MLQPRIDRAGPAPQWRGICSEIAVRCLGPHDEIGFGSQSRTQNDWACFRQAWDAKLCGEHDLNWGGLFCGWTQKVLDKFADGMENAFSAFVHGETVRNFRETVMLVVPAAANPGFRNG